MLDFFSMPVDFFSWSAAGVGEPGWRERGHDNPIGQAVKVDRYRNSNGIGA
jgi:hypothetical protein